MAQHDDPRVDGMFRRDAIGALPAVVLVWLLYAFTYYTLSEVFNQLGLSALMGGLALCVLVLNASSIIAMIKHFSEDRTAIYSRDLYYLDLLRTNRAGGSK
ncbi:conserved hypothetical protein [Methylocella tundrae]|uniref:Uncharacterized protein n=1 Tax=Methylocella tundrae TaxID=227605 RepID=A0A8B6M567_METTU|nr:hypothetical protein [Methylocella tundrae]VTZ26847.1 conserved hypothetical protein [Methylocella tundrae]VTZ49470.1 conserved hypothetical protein [Methylocella tundrae]